MRLKTISFHNWLCFAGKQSLSLDAKAYAIVANHRQDVERSNWLGKSATLEAIRFALTGWHRHRTEDDWITNGEKQGDVVLVFDDGTEVTRSRKRGQSTRLSVSGATQDEAQKRIFEMMGMTERDFLATSYFEQGQIARFITQDASERTATVVGWFQLDPLIAAEEFHKTTLSQLTWDAGVLRDHLRNTDDLERAELVGFTDFKELVNAKVVLEDEIKVLRAEMAKVRIRVEESNKSVVNDERKKQFGLIVEEGMRLKSIVDDIDREQLEEDHTEAQETLQKLSTDRALASREVNQKRQLLTGKFDGVCPVAAIPCPAKDEINSRRSQNAALLDAASSTFEALKNNEAIATTKFMKLEANKQSLQRAVERMNLLREQGLALQEKIDDSLAEADAAAGGDLNRISIQLQDQISKLATYERSIAAIEKSRAERLRLAQSLSKHEFDITVEREAKAIVGRNGAQRRIAESCLKEIEDGANSMLADCGINLSVQMRWSREGTSIASACEECGHPFPKSARAKICERCEAPRGMNIINKLEPILSNTSGAAKDLVGTAFQLSASSWMRHNHGARWSVAMLDEPFGQLDAAHRRAFSNHLATLLRSRYGFEQSFTVAHHSSVLDALPGRIMIEGDGVRSTIKVII